MAKKFSELKKGDILYVLDRNNNYEIVERKIKDIIFHWGGNIYIIFENKGNNIDILVRGNRSHHGLLFINLSEAEKYQKQIREGLAFVCLKNGDNVYVVVDGTELLTCEVENVREYKEFGNRLSFSISFKGYGHVTFDQMRYEERATELLETKFYTSCFKIRGTIKLFIKKEDAEKAIKDAERRKIKSATSKYIQQIENHDGKPISHTDKEGKQLHYGDKVAYAVSGGSSFPYISFGIIKGETKERVHVVNEKLNGEVKEEKHCVSPKCILLVKEAEFNEKSNYLFVKKNC